MKILLRLALALVVTVLGLELVLRLFPRLLPADYRAGFPMHGVEFFEPGILERTPVEGIPLPLVTGGHRGPPPADLKQLGIAPAAEDADARAFPDTYIPVDGRGLPNPETLERADIVLVGDSFTVSMGVLEPPGLQASLARETGLTVYNTGVAGLGTTQEVWMLEHVALPLEPRCVIVFFFGGNDVVDAAVPLLHRKQGRTTWSEAYADRRVPRLWTLGLARHLFASEPKEAEEPGTPGIPRSDVPAPLPPFLFVADPFSPREPRSVWLHPQQLRDLQWTAEEWRANVAWSTAVVPGLRRMRDLCAEADTKLLVVYLPSKSQVILPYLGSDPELVHRVASYGMSEPLPMGRAELLARLMANRGSLESCVLELCAAEGIPTLSALGFLEAQAARGELGYLATDTHWQSVGQAALLEPLVALLEREGVLAPE